MPRSRNNPLLFCAGCLNIDLQADLPTRPEPDARIMTTGFTRGLGGMAANVACAAKAVGGPYAVTSRLLAPCGKDTDGDWLRQQLTEKGIDAAWLDTSTATHYCLILVQADGRRLIVSEPTRLNTRLVGKYLNDFGNAYHPRLLYVDGYHASPCLDYAAQARGQGWRSAVDMDEADPVLLTRNGCRELGRAFELIFMNQACASQLAGSSASADWLAVLEPLCAATQTTVLLTLGAQGVWLIAPAQPLIAIPALAVRVVDTTGAGDVFAGVFLAHWGNGLSTADAAHRACVAASLSVTARGALGYLPSTEDIELALATVNDNAAAFQTNPPDPR